MDQVTKQLHKLINVIKIRDLDPGNQVSAELLLVRVAGEGEKRTEALQIAEIFNAKIVDVDRRQLTLRVVGTNDKLEACWSSAAARRARWGTARAGRPAAGGRSRLGVARPATDRAWRRGRRGYAWRVGARAGDGRLARAGCRRRPRPARRVVPGATGDLRSPCRRVARRRAPRPGDVHPRRRCPRT